MASTYKTPGVYIEEISKLPSSVAQVETAIPAFIGYTQIAMLRGRDLHEEEVIEPIRITSLLEYEQYFGTTLPEGDSISVTVTDTEVNAVITDPSPHNMYYSLQAYFANGGGPCYIVSVGATPAEITQASLLTGLNAIEKEDEVTLIVFPESLNLVDAEQLATPPTARVLIMLG